jgi:hypothetical protein
MAKVAKIEGLHFAFFPLMLGGSELVAHHFILYTVVG